MTTWYQLWKLGNEFQFELAHYKPPGQLLLSTFNDGADYVATLEQNFAILVCKISQLTWQLLRQSTVPVHVFIDTNRDQEAYTGSVIGYCEEFMKDDISVQQRLV